MTTDPKRSPIAALVKKWREDAKSFRDTARSAGKGNKFELMEECDTKADLLFKRAAELEAAIAAQVEVWGRTTCGTLVCIRDLKGEP